MSSAMEVLREKKPSKSVIDVMGALVVFLDRSGRIIAFNRACEQLTGYTEAEILGQEIWDLLLLPDEKATVREVFNRLRAGDFPSQFENHWVSKAGTTHLIMWSNTALLDEQGEVDIVVGTGIDVTERRRAESAIHRRDAILNAVAFASEEFLKTTDWERSIREVIAHLAEAAGATHAYLIQFVHSQDSVLEAHVHTSWNTPGLLSVPIPELSPDQANAFASWGDVLQQGSPIYGLVKDLPTIRQSQLGLMFKAVAIVPIFNEHRLWGIIGFGHSDVEAGWQIPEVDALRAAAGTFGAALLRRKDVEQRITQERFLTTLADLTRLSMQVPDFESMLQILADRIVDIVEADDCYITLWDAQTQQSLPIAASADLRKAFQATGRQPGSSSLTGATLRHGRALVVETIKDSDLVPPEMAERFHARSGIAVPLMAGSEPLGALFLAFRHPHRFTPDEIARCEQATQQVALILAKAMLLDSEQAARQRAETLRTIAEALSTSIQLEDVLDTIMSELHRVLPYDSASIQEVQGQESVIIACRGFQNPDQILGLRFDLTSEETPNRSVIQSKQPLILGDAPAAYRGFALVEQAPDTIRSWLGVPLIIGGEAIGMISLDKQDSDFYTQKHLELALAFGAQAAIAIDKAHLFAETQRRALQQKALNTIISAAATAPDLASLAAIAMDRILAMTGLAQGGIWAAGHYHRVGIPGELLAAVTLNKASVDNRDPMTLAIEDWTDAGIPSVVAWMAEPALRAGIASSFYTPVMAGPKPIGGLVLCSSMPRRWSSEETLLLQSVAQQIGAVAQRLQLTREIRQQQEQAQAQERLAALGRMAAGIAHDFNNILQGITGFAEIVARQPGLNDASQRRLDRIQEEGRRGADLVRQILDFSRQSPPNLQPVAMDELVPHLADLWRTTLPPTIRMTVELLDSPCLARADQSQLGHVFTNLVVNAVDAMPQGGALVVILKAFELGPDATPPIATMPPGGRWVEVSVQDTGCGIAADDLPRVFEPFFTTKRTGRSAGLGLARAYGIVQQHGGHITVDSQTGQGTTVTVYLPAMAQHNSDFKR